MIVIYNLSHSIFVELLGMVYDHYNHRFVKKFKMVTIGWTDGTSFLHLDLATLSSLATENRMNNVVKKMDKRSCGYWRRKEALNKSTELLEPMTKRALAFGIDDSYILMDSWFAFPSLFESLHQHRPVICMLKDLPTIQYCHKNVFLQFSDIYRRVMKRPGKAKIVANMIVSLHSGMQVKIVNLLSIIKIQ